jgi:hypothetical protein
LIAAADSFGSASLPGKPPRRVDPALPSSERPMIDLAYVQRMARYNRWQNQSLYGVADALSEDERRRERGAFFGSIHKTLSHLLWADRIWMSRFFSDVP